MLKQQDNKGIHSSMQYLHEKECGFFMIYIFTTLKFENTYILCSLQYKMQIRGKEYFSIFMSGKIG